MEAIAFAGDEVLATIGSFCAELGPIRVAVGGIAGSLLPKDERKIQAALASPVDP